MQYLFLLILSYCLLIKSSEPPCSPYEFYYEYEDYNSAGIRKRKLICLMKCPFGCGYGRCQPDGSCECIRGATYLKNYTTGEFELDMCNFQCDRYNCHCFESWCYFGFQCLCSLGFLFDEELDCCMRDPGDPCKGSCQLGTCTTEGDCECKRGYRLKKNFTIKPLPFGEFADVAGFQGIPQQCEPVCNPPCPRNSKCIMPKICECNDGFHANGDKECV